MDAERIRAPNKRVAEYYAKAELDAIAKTLIVPTSDDDVRRELRQIGEPAELNGEDRADRRARLLRLLAQRKAEGIEVAEQSEESDSEDLEGSWSDGPPGLKAARERIAAYAGPRTTARLQRELRVWTAYVKDKSAFTDVEVTRRRQENQQLKQTALVGTQSGFERAPGSVAGYGSLVVAGDWSGSLSVLDMQSDMAVVARSNVHSCSAGAAQTCVAWSKYIASGSTDGSVGLHCYGDGCLETRVQMQGHTGRVASVAFHPSNSFLVSASHDTTWRLWDLESGTCVLEQPCHREAVNTISCHEDGALVLSAGDDALGHVMDLRSGKSVVVLRGHARSVHASAWNVNNAVLGGADNQCIVWDMRHAARPVVAIPAHNDLVTGISINGNSMATSSLDGTVRLWSPDTWRLQRTLRAPTKILAVTAIEDGWVAARWDRCIDWYASNVQMTI